MATIETHSTGSGRNAFAIGMRAEYRPTDYAFPRTQSRKLSAMKWESRIRPSCAWGELVIYGVALFALAAARVLAG